MALRLVTPATPNQVAQAPVADGGVVARTVMAAKQLLLDRDHTAWREAFAATAGIVDEHDRYIARRTMLESVLASQGFATHVLSQMFTSAAAVLTDLLEENPLEPVLLNTAGVLYFELGSTKAAEALFRAAQRLDPALPDVAGNLRACKQRRKNKSNLTASLPPAVQRELRELGPRAERIGKRAQPPTDQTLSLCMIVKDEQQMLPQCLDAIAGFVDELIIVDTGSTDDTVQIAESYGAKVLHHKWTGDFSEARNVGFDAATCDWKMFLDADEVLVDGEGPKLRELLGHTWREAIYLVETNYTGELDHGTSVDHNALRIFRNRPEYRFRDRIHEQIAYSLPQISERLEVSQVRIDHFGYLGVVREERDKSRRNIELLEQQVAEGNTGPFVRFNLGSEHMAVNEPAAALVEFRAAWELMEADPDRTKYPYFPSLASRLLRALRHCGHYAEVQEKGEAILTLLPDFTDIVLEQADALQAAGDTDAAEERYRTALSMGDAPAKYAASRGAGSYMARQALANMLVGVERYEEAAAELRECLREKPNYLAAVQPLAHSLLELGQDAADVRLEFTDLVGEPSAAALFLIAVPFYERGLIVDAEELLRASLEQRPGADRARLALAEALLSRSAFEEAMDEVEKIDPDTPVGGLAARSGLFAALAPAEPDDAFVARARAYAIEASMPAPELLLFDVWHSPDRLAGKLDRAVAPLVVVMLEALARIEAFDAFERLASALKAVDLPERERREVLAGVYLSRGFIDLAANEWIEAVEQHGPDRRALNGLAMVAQIRGMDEDAAVFRQEAEALPA